MNPNRHRRPQCGTRRPDYRLLLQHCATHDHKLCDCGGYHFKHRPGSPCCNKNPMAAVHQALRDGASVEEAADIELDIVLFGKGKEFAKWKN